MDMLDFLSELIAIDTSSPKGYVRCANLIAAKAKSLGLKVNIVSPMGTDGLPRPNVIITHDIGAKKTLILNAHYDTVPPGDEGIWETKPLELVVKGGKAFGRGAGDDKGGVAVGMAVLERLKKEKIGNLNVALACTCDEEVGSELGMKYLCGNGLLKGDFGIVLDGSARQVEIACCGALHGSVLLKGRQSHASLDGYNIIGKALPFLLELQGYAGKRRKKISFLRAPPKSKRKFAWGRFNLTMLNCGVKENVMPPSLRLGFDLRILPEEEDGKVTLEFEGLVGRLLKKHSLEGKLSYNLHEGYFIPEKSGIAQKLARSYEKVFKKRAFFCTSLGATDASHLARLMPALTFAPGGEKAHGPNECIETRNLELSVETIVGMIRSF